MKDPHGTTDARETVSRHFICNFTLSFTHLCIGACTLLRRFRQHWIAMAPQHAACFLSMGAQTSANDVDAARKHTKHPELDILETWKVASNLSHTLLANALLWPTCYYLN